MKINIAILALAGLPLCLMTTLATAAPITETHDDPLPNIVVILADDMGFGDVKSLNEHSTIPTPHIDRLSDEGCTFLDGHSASAVCTPTRYSLLTGRYSWRTNMKKGVLGGYSKPLLEADRATMATMLKRAGYQTGAVGKWHLGMEMPFLKEEAKTSPWQGDPGIDFAGVITDSPIHHGFDYYFGVSASLDMAPYVYVKNDRFTMMPTMQQESVRFPHFVRKGPRAEDFVIDQVLDKLVEESVGYIARSAPSDDPFFLYVPFTAPHKPAQPKAEFKGVTELGEYGDFIAQVDDAVGQILRAVDASGESRNTIVVFTSDNGSYMHSFANESDRDHTDDDKIQGYRAENHRANGTWRGTKADIYEAGHRVPFFVRWPGTIPAGAVARQTVCQVDLFATFAQIVGQELGDDEAEDSFSILEMARGETESVRPAPVIHQSVSGMLAIRNGKWKLIAGNGSGGRQKPRGENDQQPFQLFDLEADPQESKDLASENAEETEALTALLEELRNGKGSREVMLEKAN